MNSIAKIGRSLISVFLVVLVSTLMFFTSPAMAANWTTVNRENVETELLDSDKTTVVLLVSKAFPEDAKTQLKSAVEKTYGDKYKLAVGSIEENAFIYNNILAPRIYPPLPGITTVINGSVLQGIFIDPNDPSPAFKFVNNQLGND
ncbi:MULTISPECIES: hypothetical protein [Nostoc]|uniref:Uncharacterized protein n=1 Tax=Nostoc paludosum FACHB-159 TaxID=2692908 RepID=A0ABR8KBV2_9NOSO|nr:MULTISPECIES: hypothetical protein [Nostoc]MBD2680620.1 hypothetical protein [Nostoc sp. FACHB-857]MBD2737014.1 hypothetical protein [Nostoc paludosum FACHB-159]